MNSIPKTAAALVAILGAALASPADAQEQRVGAWAVFAGQGHLDYPNPDARWRWWFDAQARFLESNGLATTILRPGIGYDISASSTLWLGYGRFREDPAAGDVFHEDRIWQQFTWGRSVDAGAFYSRTRLEQRLVSRGDDTGWRLREFIRWTQPLADSDQLGLRFWDEVFIDLNDTDWGAATGFRQNRLFAGFGWTFASNDSLTLEFGYLNQFLARDRSEDAMNHILSVQLLMSR